MCISYRLSILAGLSLLLSGCCFLIPQWPACNGTQVSFTFMFVDNRNGSGFCSQNLIAEWNLNYVDSDGNLLGIIGAGTNSETIDDAKGQNGFASEVIIYVNTTCDPNTPFNQYSRLEFTGVIPAGGTLTVTLDSNDNLTNTISPATASTQAASAVTQVTGTKLVVSSSSATSNAAAGSDSTKTDSGKKSSKKSCCW